jgi:hypothetical protein
MAAAGALLILLSLAGVLDGARNSSRAPSVPPTTVAPSLVAQSAVPTPQATVLTPPALPTLSALQSAIRNPQSTIPPQSTITREPIVPTRDPAQPSYVGGIRTIPTRLLQPTLITRTSTTTPAPQTTPPVEAVTPGATSAATRTIVPTRAPTGTPATPPTQAASDLWRGRPRWGVSASTGVTAYDLAPLRLGWYMDWLAQENPVQPDAIEYMPMVRLQGGKLTPDAGTLARIAHEHPGLFWLIGNEPDVIWQDNITAVEYARLYHAAYTALKTADPTVQVVIGGISQPTPLRLRYLDAVLAAYQAQFGGPIPADAWNIHNYMLREARDSWGVEIPPGMSDAQGATYQILDGLSVSAFHSQIVAFRGWMAEHGYRELPLFVTEYGIAMPPDYGFPPARVAAFWTATFDLFRTAADSTLGDPADGNRLVQRWCWFSLADTGYVTGNLFDPATHQMTALGNTWAAYINDNKTP